MTEPTLESLIREVAGKHRTISIGGVDDQCISLTGVTANEHGGFSACVYRYPIPTGGDSHFVNRRDPDPVAALRATLVEYLRREADLRRRYAAAPKLGDVAVPVPVAIDMDDLLG